MAIARDLAVTGGAVVATSITYSHTVTGSNTLLCVSYQASLTGDQVTGITYAGVAMSRVATALANTRYTGLFQLAGASTGANNVIVSGSSSDYLEPNSGSYTGVSQSGQPEQTDTDNNGAATVSSGASLNITVTTTTDQCWLIMGAWSFQDNITAGANTSRFQAVNSGIFDSNGPRSTGSNSIAVTASGNTRISLIGGSFAPAGAAGASAVYIPQLMTLNVG
jgi:hypothetical protein